MLNAILLSLQTNEKIKYLRYIALPLLLVNMVWITDFTFGIEFPIMLVCSYLIIFILGIILKGKSNAIYSIFSVLLWSVIIDTMTFFYFGSWGLSYMQTIYQGILFNMRFIIGGFVVNFVIVLYDYYKTRKDATNGITIK